jgi:tetratricopeptide (TPR) repeat protein
VYRAYHTREEFRKYRIFTVYVTALLGLVLVAAHAWPWLVPVVFTIYVTWSPWHYTGQNFGLAMMFARRNGVQPTRGERRALYAAFLASYALLFVSFHTGPSSDPLILSLGITEPVAAALQALLFAIVLLAGGAALGTLILRAGPAAMLAPFTLAMTQCIWFVAPALADWLSGVHAPQTRYSTGVLAIMHSAQYLWITSYYARQEASSGESPAGLAWRPVSYAAILVAGGIALFVPGPWMASYVFRADFTRSVLIFTAIVNIHHFILDGAVWKLRDGRIAALLVDSRRKASARTADAAHAARHAARWLVGNQGAARALRIAALLVLCGWAGIDQVRFMLGTSASSVSALTRAAALNPYDSSVQRRRARALIEQGRYQEADAEYRRELAANPADAEALVNLGVLATKFGKEDDAVLFWERARTVDPSNTTIAGYLAQVWADRADRFDKADRARDAAGAFQHALSAGERADDDPTLGADWFNYGQFLRRRAQDPRLVVACLLRSEQLLGTRSDPRLAAVQTERQAVERDHPDAAAAARASLDASIASARSLSLATP